MGMWKLKGGEIIWHMLADTNVIFSHVKIIVAMDCDLGIFTWLFVYSWTQEILKLIFKENLGLLFMGWLLTHFHSIAGSTLCSLSVQFSEKSNSARMRMKEYRPLL